MEQVHQSEDIKVKRELMASLRSLPKPMTDLDLNQGTQMRRNLIDAISYHARLPPAVDNAASTEVIKKFKEYEDESLKQMEKAEADLQDAQAKLEEAGKDLSYVYTSDVYGK